jgi:hypothetical protein
LPCAGQVRDPATREGSNWTLDMRLSSILLVIAICGLPLRVLAQDETAKNEIANDQKTRSVCVAGDVSAVSALVKDAEIRRGESTALGAGQQQGLLATLDGSQAEADDRSYLRDTAWTSATMTRQGPEVAIGRLNPEFAARLASAIREARGSGLPTAGIFSAYRPPAFGVGRFLDRFTSLHAYGLAVDMRGIGDPRSQEAKLWYDIAGRHGIICPYGVDSRREWNHCQPTPTKAVCRDNPLRNTITAQAPIDLAEMFKVGDWFVDNPPLPCIVVAADRPADAEAITRHDAYAALIASPAHSDRKHLHQTRHRAVHGLDRAARSRDEELKHMVAHDMRLGPSHAKTARRR